MATAVKAAKAKKAAKKAAPKTVRVWEDDPLSAGAVPIERPVPTLPKARMKLAFDMAQPSPGPHEPGTAEFRYWVAVDALCRAVAFWQPLLPKTQTWQRGPQLDIRLDAGDKLNAFYNRLTLTFFHGTAGGQTVFTAESPDVVAHECGHAILDAIRPQLWDAMSHEVAAFHESFGDMSAMLVALQLPSIRTAVLGETGGVLNRNSRVSRIAEQLGWAIRQQRSCAVDADCLRNAVNCFVYQPPDALPISGPAVTLSSAPHSYSRVFTGAFLVAMTGMIVILSREANRPPDGDLVLQASVDAAKLLVAAVQAAPVAPTYLSQVAAHFVAADQRLFNGKYHDAVDNGFFSKGLLTATSVAAATRAPAAGPAAAAMAALRNGRHLPTIAVGAEEFGLGDRPLLLSAAAEPPTLAVSAMARDGAAAAPPSAEAAARGFLRELMVRDRIALPGRRRGDHLDTHEVVEEGGALRVVRRLIDCR